MAVGRQHNWLGSGRVDLPHLRSVESATAYDFDVLAGSLMAGDSPLVVSGFTLVPFTIGNAATSMQLVVADAILMHPLASETGTIFKVPSDRAAETLNASNTRIVGSFTASAVNYVGVDLARTADSTTADLVQFLDINSRVEKPKEVPLGRTLDYKLYISTADFSSTSNVAPLLKVTTDSFNNVTAVEDARNMAFRLGSGGSVPDHQNAYSWPGGRTELGDNSDFSAADKVVNSLKTWVDAAMTRLWELGGGEHWYSPTADRNVRMIRSGTAFTNGEWFEWDGTHLHWRGLSFAFDNSTGTVNTVNDQLIDSGGLTDLADGDCIYVDVDRTSNATLTAVKAARETLGTPIVPGSRYIVAWRVGSTVYTRDSSFPVGATFTAATTSAMGIVKLYSASPTPAAPVVPVTDASGYVVARGLTRDAAGTLNIGTTANDTGITIGGASTAWFSLNATGPSWLAGGSVVSTGLNGYSESAIEIYDADITDNNHKNLTIYGNTGPEELLHVTNRASVFIRNSADIGAGTEPAAPPANATVARKNLLYFVRQNGLGSPNTRTQFCLKQPDGTVAVLYETDPV